MICQSSLWANEGDCFNPNYYIMTDLSYPEACNGVSGTRPSATATLTNQGPLLSAINTVIIGIPWYVWCMIECSSAIYWMHENVPAGFAWCTIYRLYIKWGSAIHNMEARSVVHHDTLCWKFMPVYVMLCQAKISMLSVFLMKDGRTTVKPLI